MPLGAFSWWQDHYSFAVWSPDPTASSRQGDDRGQRMTGQAHAPVLAGRQANHRQDRSSREGRDSSPALMSDMATTSQQPHNCQPGGASCLWTRTDRGPGPRGQGWRAQQPAPPGRREAVSVPRGLPGAALCAPLCSGTDVRAQPLSRV